MGYNPTEQKVKRLRKGSTFKYKGKGYRVSDGRAFEIDGDDIIDLLILLDYAADGVLDLSLIHI